MLDNLSSPYIEQAIFIMKEPLPENGGPQEASAVREAEKIVSDYLRRFAPLGAAAPARAARQKKRTARMHLFLMFMAAISILGIIGAIVLRM
ncbi:MAG: hypothetical protein Q4C12_00780 [Clostridia bacterium]|nr:hypothetical protein [Clostridia bacterium]